MTTQHTPTLQTGELEQIEEHRLARLSAAYDANLDRLTEAQKRIAELEAALTAIASADLGYFDAEYMQGCARAALAKGQS